MDNLLSQVTQATYDSAEATLISIIRSSYPSLDLRRGTVLRDILIRPAAAVYAAQLDQLEELRERMSLVTLTESSATVDPDWVNSILANFGISLNTGVLATGSVLVKVSSDREYVLPEGFSFITLDGLVFNVLETVTVRSDASVANNEIPLYPSTDGTYYYFIVSVQAETAGAKYNLSEGTALDPTVSLFGFVSAEAYGAFSDGVDSETVQEAMVRLPAAVSYRALESRTSIEAKLRAQFENSDVRIQSISCQGFGDRTQLRDKHNPMGFAVGSRVDLYVRTFTEPPVVILEKTGELVAPNTYQLTIASADAPGFYSVRSVSELDSALNVDSLLGDLTVVGSYPFIDVRSGEGIANTFHDILNTLPEISYSVFQRSVLTVSNVPDASSSHTFKVELYSPTGLDQLQSFVDDENTRNLEADYVVRCPLICMVSLNAIVYCSLKRLVTAAELRTPLVNYINTRHFNTKLTRSELSNILHGAGVTRMDLSATGMRLEGVVRDGGGVYHKLQGDILDVAHVLDATMLLAPETVVFATTPNQINIQVIAE